MGTGACGRGSGATVASIAAGVLGQATEALADPIPGTGHFSSYPFCSTIDAPDTGAYVNKTCQILYQVGDHNYRRLVRVSTGAPGYETPSGTGRVWRKWAGWHEKSLYEDGWMYDSLYFRTDHPGIALHGSAGNSLVKTYPASHGCVRVWRPDIQEIFAETPIGTIVTVYGRF